MNRRRIVSYYGLWMRPDRALYLSNRRASEHDRLVIVSSSFDDLSTFVSLLRPDREFEGRELLFRMPWYSHLSDSDYIDFLRKVNYCNTKQMPDEALRLICEEAHTTHTGDDRE